MLDAGIFTFGVLTYQDSIHIFVWSFVALNRSTRTYIGIEIESSAEGQVKRHMTFSNGCCQGSFECYSIFPYRFNSSVRDGGFAVFEYRGYITVFPLDRNVGSFKDVYHGFLSRQIQPNLGTDSSEHLFRDRFHLLQSLTRYNCRLHSFARQRSQPRLARLHTFGSAMLRPIW